MTDFWTAAAVATVFGALSSATVSAITLSRTINHKSVIEERQKWRDALRALVPKLLSEDDREHRTRTRHEIALRLNPYEDQHAIDAIDEYMAIRSPASAEAVIVVFQDLLKRDWERAKVEASARPWRAKAKASRIVDAQRDRSGRR